MFFFFFCFATAAINYVLNLHVSYFSDLFPSQNAKRSLDLYVLVNSLYNFWEVASFRKNVLDTYSLFSKKKENYHRQIWLIAGSIIKEFRKPEVWFFFYSPPFFDTHQMSTMSTSGVLVRAEGGVTGSLWEWVIILSLETLRSWGVMDIEFLLRESRMSSRATLKGHLKVLEMGAIISRN